MNNESRVKIINFLESAFVKEAIDTIERKRDRRLSDEEMKDIEKIWYEHSSGYTRMWLNYMTDDNLSIVLNKKLTAVNNLSNTETLLGRI